MRKVILTADWKDKKLGDTVELDNDEASLVVNTGFGRMSEETVKKEAEDIAKQKEAKYKPYDKSKDHTTNKQHLDQRDQNEKEMQILREEPTFRTGHAVLNNPLSKEAKEKIDRQPPKPNNPPETAGLSGGDPGMLTTHSLKQTTRDNDPRSDSDKKSDNDKKSDHDKKTEHDKKVNK